jgi:hypothetical protein
MTTPVGSEKINNVDDKLARIKQLSGISTLNESKLVPNNNFETVISEHVASNGEIFVITESGKHVYIKKKEGDNLLFIEGIENYNKFSYPSYSEATKQLNLMFKDINVISGEKTEVSILKKKLN